jgi:hypothetical protein
VRSPVWVAGNASIVKSRGNAVGRILGGLFFDLVLLIACALLSGDLPRRRRAAPPGTRDRECRQAAVKRTPGTPRQVPPDHRAITGNGPPAPAYLEARSALNGGMLAYGLVPAAAEAGCLLIGVVANLPWFFVLMGPLFVAVLVGTSLLYRNWPTGIRIDESGISIGAVRSRRAARRRPTINHQSWGLFTCPWPAVEGARVVTGRAELRAMRNSPDYYTFTNRWGGKSGMTYCNTGVLASPFMRAALVIDVDPSAVITPEIRPARYYSNFKDGYFSHLIHPRLSPAWVVPTRHPDAVSAAIQAAARIPDEATGGEDRPSRAAR